MRARPTPAQPLRWRTRPAAAAAGVAFRCFFSAVTRPGSGGRLLIIIVTEEHISAVRCLSQSNPTLFTSPRDISPPPRRNSEASPLAALTPLPPASISQRRRWGRVRLCSASIAARACTRHRRFPLFAASPPPLRRSPSARFHHLGFALRILRGGRRLHRR